MKFIRRVIKKVIRKIRKKLRNIVDYLKPYIRTRKYLGFTLFYSKGTSIVELIEEKNSIYEIETCTALSNLIKDKQNPTFIDIGSNIGLISLYMLKDNPNTTIYAFDPGPHQAMLLKKTILKNKLEKRIIFNEIALSDFDGETTFCVHDSKHVSGDGFKDTGIAGDFKKISVKTIRMDEWWSQNNKPQIDLIKVDTEGAELFVFKGAEVMIAACKPKIYFEMHPTLYKTYDYTSIDVINFFDRLNYKILTTDGQLLDTINNEELTPLYANYYAVPTA